MRLALLSLFWSLFVVSAWAKDPHSFSDPGQAVVTHLNLDIEVDFDDRSLEGTATWDLRRSLLSREIVFDTRDMRIASVTAEGKPLAFRLGAETDNLGAPLTVDLPEGVSQVTIAYRTEPDAAALQWLSPRQTAGGKEPFLFTQSQAILARTWVPCQDSPAIRFTYQARVRVPNHLLALMSASNPKVLSPNGEYHFEMPQAIPSYLLAMAVGDLRFQSLGKVCGIYAEPVSLQAAAYEFAETEKMLEAVESMYGPYRWGRYDLLLLPPSFPFGGMENPRLTFLTPTVIAGDRSLTSLIAHELAHSWSGNLVTNATWNDFWLNEGFTVYLERRIMEELKGRDYTRMLDSLALDDLQRSLAHTAPEDTRLKLGLAGRDPDEGVTDIAYEKGYFFLLWLEQQVGREKFDRFLRSHFQDNAFGSLDTETFLERLRAQLGEGLEVDAWVYQPGLPEGFTVPPSSRFMAVDQARERWQAGLPAATLPVQDWGTLEWLRFLRGLPEGTTSQQMAELDSAFAFTKSGNSEILTQWLVTAIHAGYEPAMPTLESFLIKVGRRKFLEPLYAELLKTPQGQARARAIYRKARDNYHSVAVGTIDEMLGWPY
jgi:aminopeptidase N